MNFDDQITKTIFNNLNNEMHKVLIGFYIPAIYIVYCTMFHGMNNQFEVLRLKDGTMTTVVRVTFFFTTNDVINWEFTITGFFTKMVRRRAKWISPAII